MIQVKEFSEYSINNEALTNKWIQDNILRHDVISITPFYNTILGGISYVITYKDQI